MTWLSLNEMEIIGWFRAEQRPGHSYVLKDLGEPPSLVDTAGSSSEMSHTPSQLTDLDLVSQYFI